MDHEGWDGLGAALAELARAGRWSEIGAPIDDQVLGALAVVAPIDDLAGALAARFGGLVDRLSFNVPYVREPETWAAILADVRRSTGEHVAEGGEPHVG
jgi:hypothetical protein